MSGVRNVIGVALAASWLAAAGCSRSNEKGIWRVRLSDAPVNGFSASVLGRGPGGMYLATQVGQFGSDVFEYDPLTDLWIPRTALTSTAGNITQIAGGATVLYAFAAFATTGHFLSFDGSGAWSSFDPPGPIAFVGQLSIACVGEDLYLATNTTELSVWKPSDGTWTSRSPYPGTGQPRLVSVGTAIYAFDQTFVYEYDTVSDTWQAVHATGFAVLTPVGTSKSLFVADSGQPQFLYTYDPANDSWPVETQVPTPAIPGIWAADEFRVYVVGDAAFQAPKLLQEYIP